MSTPLYYLHIPKTGGTSLIAFLDGHFAAREICPAQLLPELFALDRAGLAGYRLFRGHLWHGLDGYVGRPLRYMTMLRDPVQRTLSWYSHVRRNPGAYRHEQVVGEQWPLLKFVTDEATDWDLVNTQTLFLALDLDYGRLAADPVGYGQAMVCAAARSGGRQLLAQAKRRLESMAFFGMTERLQDSLHLMAYILGFDPGGLAPRLNVSADAGGRTPLSAEELAAIEQRTVLDRELYEWGRLLFHDRYSRMVQALVLDHARQQGTAGRAWRTPLETDALGSLRVAVLSCEPSAQAGGPIRVRAEVCNGSRDWLCSRPPNPVNLAYHWSDAHTGETVVRDGLRTPLPKELAPGERTVVELQVVAPAIAGKFRLQVRIVQEGVAWSEAVDRRLADIAVDVHACAENVDGAPEVAVDVARRMGHARP